jgi:ribosomal protein S12 methylthiotransferase accessory factor YcaO
MRDDVAGRVRRCAEALVGATHSLTELSLAGPRSPELESSLAALLHAHAELGRAVTEACQGRRDSDICPRMESATNADPTLGFGTLEASMQIR